MKSPRVVAGDLSVIRVVGSSSVNLSRNSATSVIGVLQSNSVLTVDTSEINVVGGPAIAIYANSDSLGVDGSVIQRSTVTSVDGSSSVAVAISVNADDGPFYSVSQSSIMGRVLLPSVGSVVCVSSDDRKGNLLERNCQAVSSVVEP